MRWEDLDMEKGLWTLPAYAGDRDEASGGSASLPGRVHDVPLSSLLLEILRGLPRFDGPFIFSTTSGTKSINGFSKQKVRVDVALKSSGNELSDWTVHDMRRSAATWMAGAGVLPQVLSSLLNHSPGSFRGVTSIITGSDTSKSADS
jgi:integrase